MQEVKTEKYKGLDIKICIDESPETPRNFDNLGTMACFHRKYELGDNHDFSTPDDLEEYMTKNEVIKLPLYLYDHSGITMKTTPFSCRWDSGQVGFIYTTKDKVREEFSVKRISQKIRKRVLEILKSEVKIYDAYISGEVYGYQIENNGDIIDSCWGFFDDIDYVMQTAKEEADCFSCEEAIAE